MDNVADRLASALMPSHAATPADPSEHPETEREARMAAAAAMRRLGHAMVGHEVDLDLLDRIAREATATARVVEAGARRERDVARLKTKLWETRPEDGAEIAHFDECIVSGPINPMGIAMTVRREGEQMVARMSFGHAFEGAPKRAHGGVVAAVLDDIMGYVLALEETPAYTGELSIRYEGPAPVDTPVEARAWLQRHEGRKLWISATLGVTDGDVFARAEGLFIAIPAERFRSG